MSFDLAHIKNGELGIAIVADDKYDIGCDMLLALAVVLVPDPPLSAALFDPPTADSRKESNEILRILDSEMHCANKKDHLTSHCMKKLGNKLSENGLHR